MNMSKVGIICLVLGVLGFTAFLISITIVGYIDDRVNLNAYLKLLISIIILIHFLLFYWMMLKIN